MAVIVQDCPHCGATNCTFQIVGQAQGPAWLNFLCVCGACNKPICGVVRGATNGVIHLEGNIADRRIISYLHGIATFPEAKAITAPDHIPEEAKIAYLEGMKARDIGLYTAACAMFRRTMEMALKRFAPDVEAWKLEKRIDKLATEGLITTALQQWAHRLRLDGNDAIHELPAANKEDADQMASFTSMLLIYLFTMPGQIAISSGDAS